MHSLFNPGNLLAPRKPAWWSGLLLSFGVALLFYMATSASIEHDAGERFENMARNTQYTINAKIKSYTDVMRGAASLLQNGAPTTRAQFQRYVTGLDLPKHFPAMETVNFALALSAQQLPAFEAAMRADSSLASDGYPPYQLKPPGARARYAILVFVEPIAVVHERFGFDIETRAGASLAESRDTGELSVTGVPIMLPSRPQHVGMAMRLPVYRAGAPTSNVAERRAAYTGSVGIGFSLYTLIGSVLGDSPNNTFRLALYDGGKYSGTPDLTHQAGDRPLFSNVPANDPRLAVGGAFQRPEFTLTLPIDYNGRLWKAHFSVDKNALYTRFDHYFPWLSMLAGFISTMLIYALFYTLSSSRLRAVTMAKDMTKELRDSQASLQLSHHQLRELAAHADQIKEQERKRIAREIHDDLGQNLLVLRIEADILASRTGARHPRLHARARATLDQIDSTIKSVRQIINDLRPNVLDLGLAAAVDWQIGEFRRRTGIVCEQTNYHSDITLNDRCATAFFRILQESLNNVSRHAEASRVQVSLTLIDGRLAMMISDNGVGLQANERNKVGSFGLVGIEERIRILGGTFSIISSPGAGTTVYVSVPFQATEADAQPLDGPYGDDIFAVI